MKNLIIALFATVTWTQHVAADDANDPKKAYLTSSEAGVDFAVQGEYSGAIKSDNGEMKLGVQVISEGSGKLAWAAYIGGLPGDGWDGNAPLRGMGEMQGATGILKGETGRGEAKDGSLTIYGSDNTRVAELPKRADSRFVGISNGLTESP